MKVLFVTPVYPPETSASAIYSRRFAHMASKEHTVTVACLANHYIQDDAFAVQAVKKSLPTAVRLVVMFIKLLRLMLGYDMVIVHEILAVGLPAVIAAKILGKDLYIHVPFDEIAMRKRSGSVSKWQKRITKYVLKNAVQVIVNSPALKKDLEQIYALSVDKVRLVYDPQVTVLKLPFNLSSIDCVISENDNEVVQVIGSQYDTLILEDKSLAERQYLVQSAKVHIVLDDSYRSLLDVYVSLQTGTPVVVLSEYESLLPSGVVTYVSSVDDLSHVVQDIISGRGEQSGAVDKFVQENLSWDYHIQELLSKGL
ncbi:MAG: glycosyltransferase [Patescibacteria group bacterium]